jgi:hypothetical protein
VFAQLKKEMRLEPDELPKLRDLIKTTKQPPTVRQATVRNLERVILNYRMSRREFLQGQTRFRLAKDLETIARHANVAAAEPTSPAGRTAASLLRPAIGRHPEYQRRLVGIGIYDQRLGAAATLEDLIAKATAVVDRPEDHPRLIADWARGCLDLGAARRDRSHAGLDTNRPEDWLFVSALLRVWCIEMKQPRGNWANTSQAKETGARLTRFVRGCIGIAINASGPSLDATRMLIRRVLAIMDANENAGCDWSVMSRSRGVRRRRT